MSEDGTVDLISLIDIPRQTSPSNGTQNSFSAMVKKKHSDPSVIPQLDPPLQLGHFENLQKFGMDDPEESPGLSSRQKRTGAKMKRNQCASPPHVVTAEPVTSSSVSPTSVPDIRSNLHLSASPGPSNSMHPMQRSVGNQGPEMQVNGGNRPFSRFRNQSTLPTDHLGATLASTNTGQIDSHLGARFPMANNKQVRSSRAVQQNPLLPPGHFENLQKFGMDDPEESPGFSSQQKRTGAMMNRNQCASPPHVVTAEPVTSSSVRPTSVPDIRSNWHLSARHGPSNSMHPMQRPEGNQGPEMQSSSMVPEMQVHGGNRPFSRFRNQSTLPTDHLGATLASPNTGQIDGHLGARFPMANKKQVRSSRAVQHIPLHPPGHENLQKFGMDDPEESPGLSSQQKRTGAKMNRNQCASPPHVVTAEPVTSSSVRPTSVPDIRSNLHPSARHGPSNSMHPMQRPVGNQGPEMQSSSMVPEMQVHAGNRPFSRFRNQSTLPTDHLGATLASPNTRQIDSHLGVRFPMANKKQVRSSRAVQHIRLHLPDDEAQSALREAEGMCTLCGRDLSDTSNVPSIPTQSCRPGITMDKPPLFEFLPCFHICHYECYASLKFYDPDMCITCIAKRSQHEWNL